MANISRSQADLLGAEIAEQNRQINELARRVRELEAVAKKAHDRLDAAAREFAELKKQNEGVAAKSSR